MRYHVTVLLTAYYSRWRENHRKDAVGSKSLADTVMLIIPHVTTECKSFFQRFALIEEAGFPRACESTGFLAREC